MFVGESGGIDMAVGLGLAGQTGMKDITAAAMRPAVAAWPIVGCRRGAVGRAETTD